jgi:hypothetical protein
MVVVLAGAYPASAETEVYAYASTAETNVFLGQVFTVDVIVKAPEQPDAPDMSHLDGFNVTVLDAGRATSETNTFHFRYAFRASREGQLKIPALRFGNTATEVLAIQARKPENTDRMTLTTTASKASVYLGEPVILTTTWDSTYQFGALKAVDFYFPILNNKRFQILEPYEP